MNQFVQLFPWRIAAFAGLIVGIASWISGSDLWECLRRLAMAFLLFAIIGFVFRAILEGMAAPPDESHRGRHLDQKIPTMTMDDLGSPEHKPKQGDETEQ